MSWYLLLAAAVVVLLIFGGKGPNAVWGTATYAILIGIVIAIFQPGFDWRIVGKAMIIGTFIGLAFEWLPLVAKLWTAPPPAASGSVSVDLDGGDDDQIGFGRDVYRRDLTARHQVRNDLPQQQSLGGIEDNRPTSSAISAEENAAQGTPTPPRRSATRIDLAVRRAHQAGEAAEISEEMKRLLDRLS